MIVHIPQVLGWLIAVVGIVWCIVIQRRALNKIAFGRSNVYLRHACADGGKVVPATAPAGTVT